MWQIQKQNPDAASLALASGFIGHAELSYAASSRHDITHFRVIENHVLNLTSLRIRVAKLCESVLNNDNITTKEFVNESSIFKKYSNEAFNVLVHLHLMAIQKDVYQKTQDFEMMEATNKLYKFIGGDYQRAWEIVKTEGIDIFLKELKKYNSNHP